MSLSITGLIRQKSHLDHAIIFWHEIWTSNRLLQNLCLVCWLTSKSKITSRVCVCVHTIIDKKLHRDPWFPVGHFLFHDDATEWEEIWWHHSSQTIRLYWQSSNTGFLKMLPTVLQLLDSLHQVAENYFEGDSIQLEVHAVIAKKEI